MRGRSAARDQAKPLSQASSQALKPGPQARPSSQASQHFSRGCRRSELPPSTNLPAQEALASVADRRFQRTPMTSRTAVGQGACRTGRGARRLPPAARRQCSNGPLVSPSGCMTFDGTCEKKLGCLWKEFCQHQRAALAATELCDRGGTLASETSGPALNLFWQSDRTMPIEGCPFDTNLWFRRIELHLRCVSIDCDLRRRCGSATTPLSQEAA
jgi:hypothetical protein